MFLELEEYPQTVKVGSERLDVVLTQLAAVNAGHGPCLHQSSLKVGDDLATVSDVYTDADSYWDTGVLQVVIHSIVPHFSDLGSRVSAL